MDLRGKAAIITGGGTGVGQATGIELAKSGCSVLVNYSRSKQEAEETASTIAEFGVKTLAFKADVSVDSECRAMVKAAQHEFGRLDILINNAGTTRTIAHQDLEAVTDEDWERILKVNLKGPFQCVRAAKEPLMQSGEGMIVNVASIAGLKAVGSSIPYCASKAGLIHMTMVLARALAPNIRVNCVAPGFIDGSWLRREFGKDFDALKSIYEQNAPLGKVCTPLDVADAIMSFITGSKLVTGQVLVCDGGVLLK